jgi:hypothetical protein
VVFITWNLSLSSRSKSAQCSPFKTSSSTVPRFLWSVSIICPDKDPQCGLNFPYMQGFKIFLGATYPNGQNIPNDHKLYLIAPKIYQMTVKYYKWPQNIPNDHKIYQMTTKYTNIFHCKTHRNLPKFGFLVWKYSSWQPCFHIPM